MQVYIVRVSQNGTSLTGGVTSIQGLDSKAERIFTCMAKLFSGMPPILNQMAMRRAICRSFESELFFGKRGLSG